MFIPHKYKQSIFINQYYYYNNLTLILNHLRFYNGELFRFSRKTSHICENGGKILGNPNDIDV